MTDLPPLPDSPVSATSPGRHVAEIAWLKSNGTLKPNPDGTVDVPLVPFAHLMPRQSGTITNVPPVYDEDPHDHAPCMAVMAKQREQNEALRRDLERERAWRAEADKAVLRLKAALEGARLGCGDPECRAWDVCVDTPCGCVKGDEVRLYNQRIEDALRGG